MKQLYKQLAGPTKRANDVDGGGGLGSIKRTKHTPVNIPCVPSISLSDAHLKAFLATPRTPKSILALVDTVLKSGLTIVLESGHSHSLAFEAGSPQAAALNGVKSMWAQFLYDYNVPLGNRDQIDFAFKQLLYKAEWIQSPGTNVAIDPKSVMSLKLPVLTSATGNQTFPTSVATSTGQLPLNTFTGALLHRLNAFSEADKRSLLGGSYLHRLACLYAPRKGAFGIFDTRPQHIQDMLDGGDAHHRPYVSRDFPNMLVTPEVKSEGQFIKAHEYDPSFPECQEAYVYRTGGPAYTAKWPTKMTDMVYGSPVKTTGNSVDNMRIAGICKDNPNVTVLETSFNNTDQTKEFNFQTDVYMVIGSGHCDFHTEMGKFRGPLRAGDVVKIPAGQVSTLSIAAGSPNSSVRFYSAEEFQLSPTYSTVERDAIAQRGEIPTPVSKLPGTQIKLTHFRPHPLQRTMLRGETESPQDTRLNVVDVNSECAHPVLYRRESLPPGGLQLATLSSTKPTGSLRIGRSSSPTLVVPKLKEVPPLADPKVMALLRSHSKIKFDIKFESRKDAYKDKTFKTGYDPLVTTLAKEDFVVTCGAKEDTVFTAEYDMELIVENGEASIGKVVDVERVIDGSKVIEREKWPLLREDGSAPNSGDIIYIKAGETVYCRAKDDVTQFRGMISRSPLDGSVITLGGMTRTYDKRFAVRPVRSTGKIAAGPDDEIKPTIEWAPIPDGGDAVRSDITRAGMFLYESKHIKQFRSKKDHGAPSAWAGWADVENCSADIAYIPLTMAFNGKPPGEFYLHEGPHGPKLHIILSDKTVMFEPGPDGKFADPTGHYPYPHENARRAETGGLIIIDPKAKSTYKSVYELKECSPFGPIYFNWQLADQTVYEGYGYDFPKIARNMLSTRCRFVPTAAA